MAQGRSTTFASAGAVAWRLLGIGALVVAAWWLARQLLPVLIPLVVAVLLAALLTPVAQRLQRRGAPAALAAIGAVGLLLGVATLIALLIVPPFVDGFSELGANVEDGVREVAYSVAGDVANIDRATVDRAIDDALQSLGDSRSEIAGGVLAGATALAQALGAMVLVVFLVFFLVKDGPAIGAWAVSLAPRASRAELAEVGGAAWAGLGTFARGVVFVATVDAVFVGLALVLVGVPLVLPLAVLTWIAAFFPIIGAIAAGAAAVLVALVSEGIGAAGLIALAILVVQQVEGNILYPAIVGPRVHLHPIAVLLAVTIGATIGGIPGAFLAVPFATVAAVVVEHRRTRQDPSPELALAS